MAKRNKKIEANTFETYRNLLYYPESPERLFFFGSLNFEKTTGQANPQYRAAAQHVYQSGYNYLTSNALTNTDGLLTKGSENYIEKLNQIKQFLETAIETQRANELAYFDNIINEIKHKFQGKDIPQSIQELLQFFSNITESKDFDYQGYILYINKLLQDTETSKNTQSLITYEKNRLQQIITATQQARLRISDTKTITGEKLNNKYQNMKLWLAQQDIKAQYLNTHKLTSTKKTQTELEKQINTVMSKINPPVGSVIARFTSKILPEIFASADVRNTILKILGTMNVSQEERQEQIKNVIITHLLAWAREHMVTLLQQTRDAVPIAQIQQDIINGIQTNNMLYNFQIDNLPANLGRKTGLKFFQNTKASAAFKQGEGLYQAVKKFALEIDSIKPDEITQQQKQVIQTLGIGKHGRNSKLLNKITRLQQMQLKLLEMFEKVEDKTKPLTVSIEEIEKMLKPNNKKQTNSTTIQLTIKNGQILFDGSEGSQQLIKLLKQNDYFKKRTISSKTLDTFLSSLKGQASRTFRDELNTNVVQKGKDKLLKLLEQHLNKIEVNLRGSTVDELIAGLQLIQKKNGELELYFVGSHNDKDDFVIISVDPGLKQLTHTLSIACADLYKANLSKPIQSLYSKQEQFTKTFQQNFVQDMQKLKVKSSGYHDYQEKAKKFFERYEQHTDNMNKAYKEFQATIQKNKKLKTLLEKAQDDRTEQEQKIVRIIQQIKEKISNTIYRSDTMKTYTEYQHRIGFIGGSIGTGLQEQLNSINSLFEQAGMGFDQDELILLESLIINTSYYSIIGKGYQGVIERYLSAVAAFALFDEGGAEVEILKDKLVDGDLEKSSPKILHLYRLNSIYFPGSYILQETLKGVLQLGKFMTINTHGARVVINNPINYSIIPNRPWKSGQSINTRPWQEVSQYAQNNVQLQVTFLAGMIQILKNLEKRMSDIIIPA